MMQEYIKEAENINKELNVFITINKNLQEGIPIVVKDNICTKDLRTTAGSKILEDYVPPFDATVIARSKLKGFSVLGKTNQDAFGFGTFSTNSYFGKPLNPLDKTRTCGGSSGGTAAFIRASKFVKYGLGQSTGGSINCPSAFCSVIGLTPTYGLVSRYGLIDYANSFDRIGPITKTVEDAAYLLTLIAGKDEKDQTTQEKGEDYTEYLNQDVKGMKIAYLKEAFSGNVSPEIKKEVLNSIKEFEKLGCEIKEISLPITKYLISAYYIVALAEASTNLAKFCGLRYGLQKDMNGFYNEYFKHIREKGFGKEEKRRILLGTFIRMAGYKEKYYAKALKVRQMAIAELKKIFQKHHAIITPTMPILPPKFEEIEKLSPLQHYLADFFTILPSITGLPSMSVPVKKDTPIGLQIIADYFNEKNLIKLGDAYEKRKC